MEIIVGIAVVLTMWALAVYAARWVPFRAVRPRVNFSMRLVAHRGGSLNGPENTAAAFATAVGEAEADVLEMDVCASADGVLVVSHEPSLRHSCGIDGCIGDITVGGDPRKLPQVAKTLTTVYAPSVRGQTYVVQETHVDRTRLMTLEEVLRMFSTIPLHIDIKDPNSASAVDATVELIERFGAGERTVLVSFDSENNRRLRELQFDRSGKRRYFRTGSVTDFSATVFRYYLGLLPFWEIPYDVLSIPSPLGEMTWFFESQLPRGLKWTAPFWMYLLRTRGMWRHLQRRGVRVVAWVVNTDDGLRQSIAEGLDGVMTDDPLRARHIFNSLKK